MVLKCSEVGASKEAQNVYLRHYLIYLKVMAEDLGSGTSNNDS